MSREAFLAAAVLLCTLPSADGFLSGPSLGSRQRRPVSTVACRLAASSGLNEGDAVTVIGANSPVGRLLAERLLADGRFRVRLISNNPSASELFRSYPAAEVYVGNLAQDPGNGSGLSLLKVPHATSGIERYGIPRPIVSAREILRGSDAVVIAEGTSCFPSLRWLYGLSPFNLDGRGVSNVINSMQGGNSKRLIYLSCIGAERELSRGIPKLDANILFWVLNFFGALDAKHGGEDLIRSAQTTLGVETCIVRPKLHCYESGPFGGLPQEAYDDMSYQAVNLVPGDIVDGETSDFATAGVLLQALTHPLAANKEMCVVNSRGQPPSSQADWDEVFAGLEHRDRQLRELCQ